MRINSTGHYTHIQHSLTLTGCWKHRGRSSQRIIGLAKLPLGVVSGGATSRDDFSTPITGTAP